MTVSFRLPHVRLDAFVVDHVFQPLVDRFGIDPETWAWRLFRIFALAFVTSAAGLETMAVLGMMHVTVFDRFVEVPIAAFGGVLLVQRMLRHPSDPLFDLIGPPFRLMILALAIWALPAVVISVAHMASRSAADHVPFLLGMTGFSMVIALPVGAFALYLRICRRPPPGSPRRNVVVA